MGSLGMFGVGLGCRVCRFYAVLVEGYFVISRGGVLVDGGGRFVYLCF